MLELFNQAVQCSSHLLYILKVTLVLSLYFQIIIKVLLRLIMQGNKIYNQINIFIRCKCNKILQAKKKEGYIP